MGLTGAFGFQFIEDAEGVPKIIECNPRVQGTMVTAFYAGLNIPWLAVKEAITDPKDVVPHKWSGPPGSVHYIRQWTGVGVVDGKIIS